MNLVQILFRITNNRENNLQEISFYEVTKGLSFLSSLLESSIFQQKYASSIHDKEITVLLRTNYFSLFFV